MSQTVRAITAEELEKLPEDDWRYELVSGRLLRMSPVGFRHGRTVARLMFLLERHLEGRNLGVVVAEVGFKLASRPDTVRAPDVAFIRQDRIRTPEPRGFWSGPPDLAAEVLSPDDRLPDVREKVDEYLSRGVRLVLVIDPERRTVIASRPEAAAFELHNPDDVLDLGDVVSGFRCTLRQIVPPT